VLLFILPAVVFDAIAGVLLTYGLYQSYGPYRWKMPLVKLIIKDGVIYFAFVFISNVTWIAVYYALCDKPVSFKKYFLALRSSSNFSLQWLIAVQFVPMEM
jgi:hypothetical protein